ncbi:MAG: hypothetical protein CM15mP29_3940 [Alphaproteobacteria bacterium]|nr:MAG: hypothetical protein CM15mP29_3940 [Alphaproteobacteria bacterium]
MNAIKKQKTILAIKLKNKVNMKNYKYLELAG